MKFKKFQPYLNLLKAFSIAKLNFSIATVFSLTCLSSTACNPLNSSTSEPDEYEVITSKVWAVSDMYRLSKKTRKFYDNSQIDLDGVTVKLDAAANETVSFQIILDANSNNLENIRLSASDFISQDSPAYSFAARDIRFYKQHEVTVNKFPAWYVRMIPRYARPIRFYDALEDITVAENLSLNADERLAIWVDLPIPRPAQGGDYKSEITISTAQGELKKIPLKLHVHNFILPDAKPFRVAASIDYRDIFREFITQEGQPYIPAKFDMERAEVQAGINLIKELIKRAHDHKIDLFDRHLHPKLSRDKFGNLKCDWSNFDIIAKEFLTGEGFKDKIPASSWAIPVSENWPIVDNYGSADSKFYHKTIADITKATSSHFQKIGASKSLFAWTNRNLPKQNSYYKSYLKYAKIIRSVNKSIPCMTHLPANPPAELSWSVPADFKNYTDIYAPPAELATTDLLNVSIHKSALAGHWLIPNTPPYLPTLEQAGLPADARALAWFASKYKCKGIFLPAALNWSKTSLYNSKLFYSGKKFNVPNKILSSIRLKRFRRGMQDVCYLWILRQQNMTPIARFAQNAIARYAISDSWGDNFQDAHLAGWQQNISSWAEFKPILANKIESNYSKLNNVLKLTDSEKKAWRNFFQNSCAIKIERIFSTFSKGKLSANEFPNSAISANKIPYRATISAELFNQFPANMKNVKVRIVSMPNNWLAPVAEYLIPKIPAGGRRTATIAIEGLELPRSADGKAKVQLEISADNISPYIVTTHLSYLKPAKTRSDIKIDGKLIDWKPVQFSQAGNFQMIGNLGSQKNAHAKQSTLVQMLQDDENLYISFKCNIRQKQKLVCLPTNFINYDQLLVNSEDVIEIVINPNGRASKPSQLLHFVIKSNGTLIQQQGINSVPKLGKSKPLAANTKVAVQRYKNFWIAEIAIPKSDIAKITSKFWKINFARYDTANNEASNWANVWRYYYNPNAMGTLILK